MRNFVRFILPELQTRSPRTLGTLVEKNMEKEMDTDYSVVVGGDGVENVASTEKMQQFGRRSSFNCTSDTDSDEGPSWIPTPKVFRPSEKKGDYEIEHVENVGLDDVPELSLSDSPSSLSSSPSPPTSPKGHQATSLPPLESRPVLLTHGSDTSMKSASSFIDTSPPVSSPYIRSPRRIQSTSSLLPAFALNIHHGHHDKQAHKTSRSSDPTSQDNHFKLFASSPPAKKYVINAKPAANVSIPAPMAMLPTPSVRKRRMSSGLTMPKMQGGLSELEMRKIIADYGESSSDPGYIVGDVEALVDEWSRYGPANTTVVVSAHPGALR